MKKLLSWFLVMQFSFAGYAQGLGENKSINSSYKLTSTLSEVEAQRLHETIEEEMKKLAGSSVEAYILQSGLGAPSELRSLVTKLGDDTKKTISFKLKTSGQWEMIIAGQRLIFSSADAFKERIFINEKAYSFKDKSLIEVLSDIQNMNERKSFNLSDFFIQPAYALLHIVYAIAAVVAVVVIGKSMFTYKKRTELVEGLNKIKDKFKTDANACENDGNSGEFLNLYFSSSNTSLLRLNRSVTAAERALRSEMMGQVSEGLHQELDCHSAMTKGLRATGHEVEDFTEQDLSYRRDGIHIQRGLQKADLRSRIFEVCDAYNALMSCVNTQVLHFVNNQRENYKLSTEVKDLIEARRTNSATQR